MEAVFDPRYQALIESILPQSIDRLALGFFTADIYAFITTKKPLVGDCWQASDGHQWGFYGPGLQRALKPFERSMGWCFQRPLSAHERLRSYEMISPLDALVLETAFSDIEDIFGRQPFASKHDKMVERWVWHIARWKIFEEEFSWDRLPNRSDMDPEFLKNIDQLS